MTNKPKRKRAKKQRVTIENKNLVNKMCYPNLLKYYRITMYWAKRNYDVTQAEMDLLFFLYDVPVFTSDDFHDFSQIVPFNYRKMMIMMQKGWIIKWRDSGINKKALYRISPKGKRLVTSFYKKLTGLEPFAESTRKNEIMKLKTSTDKIMARKMKEINAANRKKAARVVWVRGDEDLLNNEDVVESDH